MEEGGKNENGIVATPESLSTVVMLRERAKIISENSLELSGLDIYWS